jgi:hypothetical protein
MAIGVLDRFPACRHTHEEVFLLEFVCREQEDSRTIERFQSLLKDFAGRKATLDRSE